MTLYAEQPLQNRRGLPTKSPIELKDDSTFIYNSHSTSELSNRLWLIILRRYPYITILQNFSQMWALYCLVQFYYATKHELHEINPLAKFLCFKAVVFVTWWQGVVIALVFATGLAAKWLPFHPSEEQADMLQTNLQDFIICIEVGNLFPS